MIAILCVVFFACNKREKSADYSSHEKNELPPKSEYNFFEITEFSGLDMVHSIGDEHLSNLIESVGGGAALLDYDQDGYLDIYFANGSFLADFSGGEAPDDKPINHLFRNLGDGTFTDVTIKAGVGDTGFGMGITVGDFNNDGFPDIYLSNYGPNVLYQNNGDGTFKNVTKSAGVAGNECSVGAVWLDYDLDGLLDLYVGNYVDFDPKYNLFYAPDGFPGPMNFDGQPDVLYHNLGDGKFQNVTGQMGVYRKDGRAMGVGAADYNDDGYPDIYVANDHMVNFFFQNNEGKGFTDVAISAGVAFNQVGEATTSMAVDFADYNGDGLLDLFVSDDSYSSLYANQGNGVFTDLSYPAGVAISSGQFVGWTSAFIDYDNDMDLDIFKVNGELQHLYGQEDQLFENIGNGKFEDISAQQGPYFQRELVGRGGCFGDYDNDGDLDAFIVNLNDRPVLLRNDRGSQHNWILIQLIGNESNKDGIGARIKITTGEKVQVAERKNASGYLSQNDPRVHFGLGSYDKIDEIVVKWPSGKIQTLSNVSANQILKVEEE